MVVAITEGMGEVAHKLRGMGYCVVKFGEYKNRIDAVVYTSGQLAEIQPVSTNFVGTDGILMINAKGKTIGEIDSFLKRRQR